MARKFRPKAIAAKIQSGTYGDDSVPTAALNAMQSIEGAIQPLVADEAELNVDTGTLGNYLSRLVGKHTIVNFKVPVAGAGALGVAPAYDPLLELCGMAGVPAVGVDYRYNFVGGDESHGTIYFWVDGALHAVDGVRGKWKWAMDAKGYLFYDFEFMGLYKGPVTATMPALTLGAFSKPLPVNNANTFITLDSVSPVLVGMEFDSNTEMFLRDVPGQKEVIITDRKPAGSVTIDAPDIATKNWFDVVTSGDPVALLFTHGTVAGNIVDLSGASVQCSTIDYTDNDKALGYQMTTRYIPTSGNDEVELIIR